jgi:hypothetical protein
MGGMKGGRRAYGHITGVVNAALLNRSLFLEGLSSYRWFAADELMGVLSWVCLGSWG